MGDQDALGREYLLHEEIGRGALAVVRRATRRSGGPSLAAKLLRPELAGDRRVRGLFLREEAALRHLDHPGIVGFRDLVVEGGTLALLMDFVDGPDLRRHLAQRGGRLPAAETAAIAAQVAAALAAAHAQGVVHLDLKPENLLLVRGSDPPDIRVTDFGVAVLLRDADLGVAGGTPGYTAPEIWHGAAPTPAADVFSLGVLLVELFTGDLQSDPDSLPPELAAPARDCLSPAADQRPTAQRLATYLHSLVGSGVLGRLPAPAAPAPSAAAPLGRASESRQPTVRGPRSDSAAGPWAGAFAGGPPPAGDPTLPDHLGHWAGQLAGAPPSAGHRAGASSDGGRLAGAPLDGGRLAGVMPERASGEGSSGDGPGGGWLAGADPDGGWLAGGPPTGGWLAGAPTGPGRSVGMSSDPGEPGPRLRTGVTPPAGPPGGPPKKARGGARRWRRGPLVTLGVVVAVAAALVGVNIAAAAEQRADDRRAAVAGVTGVPSAEESAGPGENAGTTLPPTEPVRAGASTGAPAPVRISLAGYVSDDAGALALSIRDERAVAYICDGDRIEAWLKGTAKNGVLTLSGKNGAKLVGTFDQDSARGQVTVIGETHDFTLRTVKKPSGLYRITTKVRDARVEGAWIVLPDGRQVGVLTEGAQTGPAPQLDVGSRTTTVGGTPLAVTAVDADTGTGF